MMLSHDQGLSHPLVYDVSYDQSLGPVLVYDVSHDQALGHVLAHEETNYKMLMTGGDVNAYAILKQPNTNLMGIKGGLSFKKSSYILTKKIMT